MPRLIEAPAPDTRCFVTVFKAEAEWTALQMSLCAAPFFAKGGPFFFLIFVSFMAFGSLRSPGLLVLWSLGPLVPCCGLWAVSVACVAFGWGLVAGWLLTACVCLVLVDFVEFDG